MEKKRYGKFDNSIMLHQHDENVIKYLFEQEAESTFIKDFDNRIPSNYKKNMDLDIINKIYDNNNVLIYEMNLNDKRKFKNNLKIILEKGYNINTPCDNNRSILTFTRDFSCIKLLVENEIDLNIVDDFGENIFAYHNNYDIIKYLLESGTNTTFGNKYASNYFLDGDIKNILQKYENKYTRNKIIDLLYQI